MNQRILVTGGAGFIGSHLCEALLRAGVTLSIVDNLNDFYPPAWKQANLAEIARAGVFEFSQTDICDVEGMSTVFRKYQPEVVVHLAAYAGVRPSMERPRLYQQVNIGGTANLLELCREFAVKKFILASSSSVYGANSRAPFSEAEAGLQPISPYAATKLAGEMLAYTYAHLFGLPVTCLRFFTVYGPRQRPDLAIHKFIALMEAGAPVPIFGNGTTGRDYTYVDDIVAGVLAALEYEPPAADGRRFEIFNLGNSHPVTLLELLESLETATGWKAERQPQALQPGDVPLTWADLTKSRQLLGYEPKTRLDYGLQRFVSWYRAIDSSRKLMAPHTAGLVCRVPLELRA
jgi:UDP-glucuronate 4-epimerase